MKGRLSKSEGKQNKKTKSCLNVLWKDFMLKKKKKEEIKQELKYKIKSEDRDGGGAKKSKK